MSTSLPLLSEVEPERPLSVSELSGKTGSTDLSELRGYEVMAIVLCLIILAAIFMCYLSWKFRYKIVLRTKVRETTVVQNLVALTLQEMVGSDGKHRNSHWEKYNYYHDGSIDLSGQQLSASGQLPQITVFNEDKDNLHHTYEIEVKKETAVNEGISKSSTEQRWGMRSISESRSEGGGQRLRCESLRSAVSEDTVHVIQERIREPRNRGRGRYRSNSLPYSKKKKQQRALVLSAVKLSSGQSLPRTVDLRKLGVCKEHPLKDTRFTRSLDSESGWNLEGKQGHDLDRIKEKEEMNAKETDVWETQD